MKTKILFLFLIFSIPLTAQGLSNHFITVTFPLDQDEKQYFLTNPSIQKTKSGYKVICRAVNYTQIGAKEFHSPDGIFRTKNFLIEYDKDLNLLSQKKIIEKLPRKKFPFSRIEGLEDCRIFNFSGSSWFTCTTSDTNPCCNLQISLCKLEEDPKTDEIRVEKLVPLIGPNPFRCEKNWLPFVQKDLLYVIYSYDPFVILKPDIQTGRCEVAVHYDPGQDCSNFRGSAGPIEFEGGFLLLVHEVVLLPDQSRIYLHRFLDLDAEYRITKVSKPFYFDHLGVEYCCGMTLDHSGRELLMTVGIEDREARIYFVDLASHKKQSNF